MTPREWDQVQRAFLDAPPDEPAAPRSLAEIRADVEAVEWRVAVVLQRLDKLGDDLAAMQRSEREAAQ